MQLSLTNRKALIQTVHPFPARMAAEIAFEELSNIRPPLRVLDPMIGSGTTAAVAVRRGHKAFGFDTDPLAVLMTKVWCTPANRQLLTLGDKVLERAKRVELETSPGDAFPFACSDPETKKFIRFWYDPISRKQLYSLSEVIRSVSDEDDRNVLWCAFSRMIIKKSGGVSLGSDVSHSRPHKTSLIPACRPFDIFKAELVRIFASLDRSEPVKAEAEISIGDARELPLPDQCIDAVITSPPYFNAIDYLRGHRLSLVWMGYPIQYLRAIRANNIGTEVGRGASSEDKYVRLLKKICSVKSPAGNFRAMLLNYLTDLDKTLMEISRVLTRVGTAVFVIGNSCTHAAFIRNSVALRVLAKDRGFDMARAKVRCLPPNRRYLPPPSKIMGALSHRMKTEVVLTFKKHE